MYHCKIHCMKLPHKHGQMNSSQSIVDFSLFLEPVHRYNKIMTLKGLTTRTESIPKEIIITYHTLLARYGYKPPCEFSAIEPRIELKLMTAALEALSGSDDLFCAALFKRGMKA